MNIPLMILMVDVPPFHDDDLKRSKCIPRSKRRSEVLLVEGPFASSVERILGRWVGRDRIRKKTEKEENSVINATLYVAGSYAARLNYILIQNHGQFFRQFDLLRMKASLASLLISAQALLYAIKLESIVFLLTKPLLNAINKLSMA